MTLWADGLWAEGFWADGLWSEVESAVDVSGLKATVTRSGSLLYIASVSLSYVAGTDIAVSFAVTDEDDAVVNITGTTLLFAASRSGESPALSTEDATVQATITNGAGGLFDVTINASDTATLLGTYRFQAQIENALGEIATVARGFITFRENLLSAAS